MSTYAHKVIIAIVFLHFVVIGSSYARNRIVLMSNPESDLFTTSDCEYIVMDEVDLRGREIKLPSSCEIRFNKNGRLVNGSLIGQNTRLLSLRKGCLGTLMKGKWIVPIIRDVYFDWTYLFDNQVLDNISEMQSESIKNKVYLTKPQYNIVMTRNHTVGLLLKSCTELINRSVLCVAGNDLVHYAVISVTANNVIINGGQIIGDVGNHTYLKNSTSQWGFGIFINKSSNISVSDIQISKCIGDGVYIGGGNGSGPGDYLEASSNIVLKNIECDDNRRQGISITYADGIIITDCVFSNTGKTEEIAPGSGLDIEPNEGQSVKNIIVKRCRFLYNTSEYDAQIGGYQIAGNSCNVENISFDKCVFSKKINVCSGGVKVRRSSMAGLSINMVKMPKDKVFFDRCNIVHGSGVIIRSYGTTIEQLHHPVYTFKSCTITISMERSSERYAFNLWNQRGNEIADLRVVDCKIIYPDGNADFEAIRSHPTVTTIFKRCSLYSKGRSVNLTSDRFKDCKVID